MDKKLTVNGETITLTAKEIAKLHKVTFGLDFLYSQLKLDENYREESNNLAEAMVVLYRLSMLRDGRLTDNLSDKDIFTINEIAREH